MTTCPSCSTSLPEQALACPACGASLVDESAPTRYQPAPPTGERARGSNVSTSSGAARGARFVTGEVLAGRYRIVNLVGKGGMGEVYKAEDLKLDQVVALKFLPDAIALDGDMLARFHNEVRIARQVSHPNVCHVYDIGEVQGMHFLSMEFIDGEDLASLLRRIGRLPGDKAVEIARQICAGLAAAHENGVLHRDLKPANVMIDGRGKARIFDFGLAVVSKELRRNDVTAGTPAYMAPEQLTNKEVTERSDIYALGLVLYELFTGKRVFEAASLHELIQLHENSTPATPTTHVKEIDPLVESVIMRCLEKDPRRRPASAIQVAAALPGGDPLAAAIAAGETPSPEMVAAAPKAGALRPSIAAACYGGFIVMLSLLVLVSGRTTLHRWVPFEKSTDVLAERASNVVARLGYTDTPGDQAYGFGLDYTYASHAENDSAPDRWRRITAGQPLVFYFWFRQSPRALVANSSTYITESDPPNELSGMTLVILDPRGRLVEFTSVPPQFDKRTEWPPVNWNPLFVEAGLDPEKFSSTESQWSPPGYADQRAAWEGKYADHPDVPIRLEAAAYRGQPVYFRVVAPWDKPLRQEETRSSGREIAGIVILMTVLVIVVVAAVMLMRRNLRLGRGDRQGAFKLAFCIFLATLLGKLVGADHVAELAGEMSVLYQAVSYALFIALMLWTLYIALEPYVRRRWPQLLISWTRLLAGDVRDPMVGRDVLAGALIGIGHTTLINANILLNQWFDPSSGEGTVSDPSNLTGFSMLLGNVSTRIGASVFFGMASLFFLLLLYLVFKKRWLAATIMWSIIATVEVLFFATTWITAPFNMAISALMVIAIARFGLLTSIVCQFVFFLSFIFPLTTDLSSWYANRAVFGMAIMVALASYGAYVSLGGQRMFQSKLLDE